ncbi:hypothetical protein [Kineococcus sp. SYSU DK004]|uniref:hypothetical protein n=1 Tax=Kineococcus sp. SYSU DK004 TaxID=3383125 RepID=UPI003D7E5AFB
MTPVQRACAVGAPLWLFAHAPLVALLSLETTRAPALSLAAVVLVCGVSAWLLRPLRGGPVHLPAAQAWAAAAVLPLAGLVVMPHLPVEAWRTYANWWPGAVQVVAAALIVRRRWRAALAGEVGLAAVVTACVLPADPPGTDAVTIAALCQPAIMWCAATAGVRHLFDRAERDVARYEERAGVAVAEAAAAAARDTSARQRRAELQHDVVPLLRRIAQSRPGGPATDGASAAAGGSAASGASAAAGASAASGGSGVGWAVLARECAALERQLRDDLHARALLDGPLRARLRAAREAGASVDVVDDRREAAGSGAAEDLAAGVRALLAVALAPAAAARGGPGGGRWQVTARLAPGGRTATLAVEGPQGPVHDLAARLRRADVDGVDVRVDVVGVPDERARDGAPPRASLWAELGLRGATVGAVEVSGGG